MRTLSVAQAAELLQLSRSQVHRLLQAYDRDGAAGLASKKRGRPSNHRYREDFRNLALDLVREHYADFGPTLACEKLIERHQVSVSKETLRKWMAEAGIWTSRRERKRQIHQPRGRRDCLGELVQIDGSHHWWFENRGPKCALLVYIDDATGRLLHLRFAGSENTFDYFHATKAYLKEWGKPIAFYSDKHGVFRTTHASEKDRTSGLTQFGRALFELNIDIICANTPQAKGRVERANQTLQDRLVKELRLRDISSIEAANAYAPEFIADFNARFGKEPRNPKDMHRALADHENLDGVMCRKEVRTVSQALTLRYDKVLFVLKPTELAKSLARKKVIVCDFPDGRLEIMHEGVTLPYRTF
ncbi:MAG TPA: ISNCY family transposase, partial [Pararhizobium sp.]|nr:ISNCY family transposase [Pararhizobium sp.]